MILGAFVLTFSPAKCRWDWILVLVYGHCFVFWHLAGSQALAIAVGCKLCAKGVRQGAAFDVN